MKQISLLKLQTCISTILDPRQCLAMPASSNRWMQASKVRDYQSILLKGTDPPWKKLSNISKSSEGGGGDYLASKRGIKGLIG